VGVVTTPTFLVILSNITTNNLYVIILQFTTKVAILVATQIVKGG